MKVSRLFIALLLCKTFLILFLVTVQNLFIGFISPFVQPIMFLQIHLQTTQTIQALPSIPWVDSAKLDSSVTLNETAHALSNYSTTRELDIEPLGKCHVCTFIYNMYLPNHLIGK